MDYDALVERFDFAVKHDANPGKQTLKEAAQAITELQKEVKAGKYWFNRANEEPKMNYYSYYRRLRDRAEAAEAERDKYRNALHEADAKADTVVHNNAIEEAADVAWSLVWAGVSTATLAAAIRALKH